MQAKISWVLMIFFLFVLSYKNILCETSEALINYDCYYYQKNNIFNKNPSGNLAKGQKVTILEGYYIGTREDGVYFDIYVEIQALDDKIKAYVREGYITYIDRVKPDLWFKNILLTRNYYYTGTVEDIYNKEYLSLLNEGVGKTDSIKMMGHFFSEHRMLVSENFLVIGNDDVETVYRLITVEKNKNNYILRLLDRYRKEFGISSTKA